jgi:hypothetical protein
MGAVTIEESDDERSIVTPNCRLVFRQIGDRWTHGIEVRDEGSPDAVRRGRRVGPFAGRPRRV